MLKQGRARPCSSKASILKKLFKRVDLPMILPFLSLHSHSLQVLRVLQDIFDELCSCFPRFCFGNVVPTDLHPRPVLHLSCCRQPLFSFFFLVNQALHSSNQGFARIAHLSVLAYSCQRVTDIPPQIFARCNTPHSFSSPHTKCCILS